MRKAREAQGWSQRELSHLIEVKYLGRYSVTYSTLSKLESGIYDNPRHNTLVALASLKFIFNPVTNQPFSEDELSDIAAEFLDPTTGRYRLNSEQPTIADLIDLTIKNQPKSPYQLSLEKLAMKAQLDPDRLEAIWAGQLPTESELIKLAQVLIKDDGTYWQELELLQICQSNFSAHFASSNLFKPEER